MASPSSPKLVPGTTIEYLSRRQNGLDFLIEGDWPVTLGALGYQFFGAGKTAMDEHGHEQRRTWVTARVLPPCGSTTKSTYERQVAPKCATPPMVAVEDETHRRYYHNEALKACIEEQIAKIQADYERDARKSAKKNHSYKPNPVRRARWTPPVMETHEIELPSPHAMPKTGSPEWKRLIRKLYREHTGKSAPSITGDVIRTLRAAGLIAA